MLVFRACSVHAGQARKSILSHTGLDFARRNALEFENVRSPEYRYQRTIARPVEVQGVGFLTGNLVRLRFVPAPPDSGVVFVREDLRPSVVIPARLEEVSGTQRRTTVGRPPAQVGLVEHVLAALAGLRIDNCRIELNALEPPGLDGSSRGFVEALHSAGYVLQTERRAIYSVDTPVVVEQQGATLALHPADDDELTISYILDYGPQAPIMPQRHTEIITPGTFAEELAGCRTFLLESEATELRRQGFGSRITASDLVVFGARGPIANMLRFANEPARHKILDIVGDLALLGHDVRGHVVAYRSGHPLNVELGFALRRLFFPQCFQSRPAA
jgi:UDP-3-O-acyl N-acetylglucosamine deacetylase